MLVNPSSPAHNVKEFIDYAKKNPVFYGSPGIGNGLHLAAALFNKATGLHMEHVPFKGASEVSAALLGGDINVMFVTPPSVIGLVKSGQLRALAFTGIEAVSGIARRAADEGYRAGLSAGQRLGHLLRAGKDAAALVDKLNAAVRHALTVPAVVNVVQKSGYHPGRPLRRRRWRNSSAPRSTKRKKRCKLPASSRTDRT